MTSPPQRDDIIATAMLLGATFSCRPGDRGSDRQAVNHYWTCYGERVTTGYYQRKDDAAQKYLMKLGYQINAAGEPYLEK